MLVGPTPEALHELRRQCVVEDVASLLSRHIGKSETDQVAALINQLFDAAAAARTEAGREAGTSSTVIPLHPRNKHLH